MCQMAITGYCLTYIVVWTRKGLPLIEKIVFVQDYWDKIHSSVIVFFKTYIHNVLLGFKTIYTCPTCSKHTLKLGTDDEKSVKCERCLFWYHSVVLNSNMKHV